MTWRDLAELQATVARLEASLNYFKKDINRLNDEVHKLRWWIVASILGSTVLAIVVRIVGV